ncbi:hypothetical protein FDP41_004324 [Naegleria fowleri]|uniref:RanBD1 domain-containing protein n=1 Tax=Naegleria fowleri TaxID=5763 RepID=A0A6A5BSR0_NAEFO|nr:uncharacterized protein FDP41_004324 [Naegleria fowleri]KAF0976425.1 hypothetical protein FDP41_004324 [Naegleria fowleri]
MSKRTNEHQLTSDNFRDQDEEETEAGHFEKASEDEIRERKPIKAKRKHPAGSVGVPTTTFNFAVPPPSSATTTTTATTETTPKQLAWSFSVPSQQQQPQSQQATKPSFAFNFGQTTPTPSSATTTPDAKDLRIKELEKRVKELENETEQLKKQLQEKKSGAPTSTTSSGGGFAFSFDQSATKPFAYSFPQPASNAAGTTHDTATEQGAKTATTNHTTTPIILSTAGTDTPSSSSSTTASEPQKFSFGGFSTFSNPFSGASSNLGESQFKFEISNKPPSWTNTDYKPKVASGGAAANEEDEEGGDATDYEPSLPAMSHKIIDLPPVELKSGEENEKLLGEYKAAKLYRSVTVDGKSTWQQRGVGTLKINLNKNDEKDARLVIRADSVLKLILNAKIFKGMKFSPFQEQSIIFSVHKSQICEQLTPEELSKEPEFIPHLIRFDQKSERADFKNKVEDIVAKLEK